MAASRRCAACGGAIADAAANYCGACGTRIAGAQPAVLDPARTIVQSIGRIPPGQHPGWTTEIRYATVLFVDLVRSTEMVALLDAEGAMHRLQPVLDLMRRTVEEFGGTVLSMLGDGIVALFGALRTEERHAELACRAALAIRGLMRAQPDALAVRAGLHAGEIVVHHLASDPAGTLQAFGVTLHLASRLPAEVAPGEICLSEACHSLVRQGCTTRPLGDYRLRGVPQPVRLHLLDDLTAMQARPAFGTGTTPLFLGRGRELGILQDSLSTALAGAGGTVCVVGAPGTGKSRLCHEFADVCRTRHIPVFRTAAQPHGATSPLRLLGLLLKDAYFGQEGRTTDASVSAVLAGIGATTSTDLALVCNLLDVPVQERSQLLTAQARVARLVEIVGRLVRVPDEGPRVLMFEDAHWIDEPGRILLAAVAHAVRGTSTLLVINSRPTEDVAWPRPIVQMIDLTELSPSDTCLLVDHLVGSAAELVQVRTRVVARSAGNPFFAEELVRSLVDDGVLAGRPGAYEAGTGSVATLLPMTVQAVIGSRIDRLPRPDRDLLHVSAVVGKEFDLPLLLEVAEPGAAGLPRSLDRLCTAGLVTLRDRKSSGRYEFRHPLIQEVAYTMQLKERRSHLHAQVARAMRALYPDCDGDMAGIIAVHLEEAGQHGEAAVFAAQAARWVGQHSSSAAIGRWHKVRALLSSVPEAAGDDALRIEANGQIAWLGWREGHTAQQAEPFLQEALATATRSNHPMTSLLMLARGRMAQVSGGDADVFVNLLQDAAALAELQGDRGRMATMQVSLSHAYGWAGLLRQALAANDASLAGAHLATEVDHQFLGYDVKDWALSLRGRILLRLGLLAPARECFDQMIGLQGTIDPTVTFVGHFGYVELAQHLGDAALAAEHAGQLDALAHRHGNAYLTFYAAVSKALAAGVAGRLDDAMADTRFCLDLQRRSGAAVEFEPELLASLADYQKRAGLLAEAVATAGQAAAVARPRNARLPLCRAAIVGAEAAMLLDPARRPEAAQALGEAAALLASTGARIYAPSLERAQHLVA